MPSRFRAAAKILWRGVHQRHDDEAYRLPDLRQAEGAILDVGADDGAFGLQMAALYPHLQVYAFEPLPDRVQIIRQRAAGRANYEVVPCAVSLSPGTAKFNVAGPGCSSLMSFAAGLSKSWPGRKDFQVSGTLDVPVIRLDDFIRERNIRRIAYLHIDAQGSDLDVLRSCADYLPIIQQGCLEVATDKGAVLYQGAPTLSDIVRFFDRHDFTIQRILPNEPLYNEVNVYFRRNPEGS